jgi:hypothetical protein
MGPPIEAPYVRMSGAKLADLKLWLGAQNNTFSLSISILSRSFIYTSYYRRRFYGKLNNTTDWLLKLYFHQFLWRWRVEQFKNLSHAQGPTGNARSSFKITWASGYKTNRHKKLSLQMCWQTKLQRIHFATHLSISCGRSFGYGKSFMYSIFMLLTISGFA